jgi:hypothetical protein
MALAALAGAEALPSPRGGHPRELVGAGSAGGSGKPLVTGHCHHIAEVLVFQPAPQAGVVAVAFIRGEPAEHRPGVSCPGEHAPGQLGFRREAHRLADPGLGAPVAVGGPGRREIQFAVNQRPAWGRHVSQEHPELAILDTPGGPRVLALHSGGFGAFLQESSLIGHHHPTSVTELLQHIPPEVIAHRIGVPGVEVQQALHAIGGQVPGRLSDRPGVLPLRPREQAQHIHPGPATGLHLRETARDQREHVIKPRPPPLQRIIDYCPRRGHRVFFEF